MTHPPILAAVSGGIDSMLMLDELQQQNWLIIIAHINHGLRGESSDADEKMVIDYAATHHIACEVVRLNLRGKSEDESRRARWQALRQLAAKHHAVIATAHHQDDVLETMMINLVRGTGWRGLGSLRETAEIMRPLIHLSKAEVIAQAIERRLTWHDDELNYDLRYLRNYIRSAIIPKFSITDRHRLLEIWQRQCDIKTEVELLKWPTMLRRHDIIMNELPIAREILRSWLASHGMMVGEAHRLSQLVVFAKAARPQARMPLPAHHWLIVSRTHIMIE